MDELDLKIASLLAEDGRISYRDIAKRLKIAEPTARYRVKQLLESGKVKIHASLDLKHFPELIIAYVGIKQIGNPLECLDRIRQETSSFLAEAGLKTRRRPAPRSFLPRSEIRLAPLQETRTA